MCLGVLREVVLAADDVADLHRRVVDDDREVVERRAVAADDDEVAAEVRDVDLDVAADDVVERDDALADPEAERPAGGPRPRARPARPASGARSGRRSGAAACAASWAPAVGVELLGRAVAGIGAVRAPGAGRGRRVESAGAPSGGTGAYGPRASSPATSGPSSQSRPSQCRPSRMSFSYAIEPRAWSVSSSRRMNVPPVVPGEEEVEQRRPGRPDVERPGRARRDADADRIAVREVGHPATRPTCSGTRWNSAGIGLAGQDADERRRPQARASPGRAARRASANRAIRSGRGS